MCSTLFSRDQGGIKSHLFTMLTRCPDDIDLIPYSVSSSVALPMFLGITSQVKLRALTSLSLDLGADEFS